MRSPAPALLPIFRSQHQARLLATLYLHPGREYGLGELARQLDIAGSTLHREVERLVYAGLVRDRVVGGARLVSAATDNRFAGPLTELLAIAYGPLSVVGDEFGTIDEVDLVLIYGSWAARYTGEPGPPPQDVDVLVVGAPARTAVYDAADRARQRLGIPVNPVLCSRRRWAATADALVQEVKRRPSVTVVDHGTGSTEG